VPGILGFFCWCFSLCSWPFQIVLRNKVAIHETWLWVCHLTAALHVLRSKMEEIVGLNASPLRMLWKTNETLQLLHESKHFFYLKAITTSWIVLENPVKCICQVEEIKLKWSWAPVVHSCNPSYSRGRDQEDCGSKPAQTNSSKTLSWKNHHKKELVEWLKV
jgi:hypothetical protein